MMIRKHQRFNKPKLDYPYLSLPDIDEDEIEYKPKNKSV
jgi:hypothetical protein